MGRCGGAAQHYKLCGYLTLVLAPVCPAEDAAILDASRESELSQGSSRSSCLTPVGAANAGSRTDDTLSCRGSGCEEDGDSSSCADVDELVVQGMMDLSRLTGRSAENCDEEDAMEEAPVRRSLQDLVGATCWLTGKGSDTCVAVDNSTIVLRSPPPTAPSPSGSGSPGASVSVEVQGAPGNRAVQHRESQPCTPGSVVTGQSSKRNGGSRKRKGHHLEAAHGQKKKCAAGIGVSTGILYQLGVLVSKNGVSFQGRIVKVFRRGSAARAVVMLDLYVPSPLWSVKNLWKSSPAAAASLSHLSCDWEKRKNMVDSIVEADHLDGSAESSIWDVGECHVLGCLVHKAMSEAEKQAKFDLPTIFEGLPAYHNDAGLKDTSLQPTSDTAPHESGLWDIPDEILVSMMTRLRPKELVRVASVCRHTRALAASIMPCMKLKLFPHQQAAVSWMLQRELHSEFIAHSLFQELHTVDGFPYSLNLVTGDLSPELPPAVEDFKGGLFCDEPGLGKTVTALSLILKTQGTLSQPPDGVQVRWCDHHSQEKVGYYESNTNGVVQGMSGLKRYMPIHVAVHGRRPSEVVVKEPVSEPRVLDAPSVTPRPKPRKRCRSTESDDPDFEVSYRSRPAAQRARDGSLGSGATRAVRRSSITSSKDTRRKLFHFGEPEESSTDEDVTDNDGPQLSKPQKSAIMVNSFAPRKKQSLQSTVDSEESPSEPDEIWVQCDACRKWRKLPDGMEAPKEGLAWFCSMNKDPDRQQCASPEESWGLDECIRTLPGFVRIGSDPGQEQNVLFFKSVLREHAHLLGSETKKAVEWLANQTVERLTKAAASGLELPPGLRLTSFSGDNRHHYFDLFRSFGLVQTRTGRGVTRWRYPKSLDNLILDAEALKVAYSEPVQGLTRLYLSRATLVVVPQNLVEHWRNQISKHTRPNQLRVFIWVDQKNVPLAHNLAWDYDVVITTFSRLSMEWGVRDRSALMHIHWLRIILDEGHTLGASLSLTNKLQMAMSMHASRRWILTGTPLPNTPSSQVAHLQPMLKFLHEGVYGKHQKVWEGAILRPFQEGREEGRSRLMSLLQRCMISARKSELKTIPPCLRTIKLLDFTEKHAASYNELVVTVKRNILMADWNDPSHVESLLNPRQWKFRSTTIRNVRLSCCVAGNIKVRNAGEDIKETMDMLVEQGMDASSQAYMMIRSALLHGSSCDRCKEWCRLPIVTPCRHLLCLSCTALDSNKCTLPGCGNAYKMQSPADLTRPENPHPKWPVPQDLIELQPSYVQDNWNADWQSTSSSKVSYLVNQLNVLRASYEAEAAEDVTMDREMSDEILFRMAHAWRGMSCKNLPPKAIVFSQFLEHIHVVEKQLTDARIQHVGMYSPMHSVNKTKSLLIFEQDPECMVLVMDGSAALGLDLSFVTHVFLMEPIWDRSMEEQVVSRAHRLGATRPVMVETLAMRGTIEEQMLSFLQESAKGGKPCEAEAVEYSEPTRSGYRTVHDFAESNYLVHLEGVQRAFGTSSV